MGGDDVGAGWRGGGNGGSCCSSRRLCRSCAGCGRLICRFGLGRDGRLVGFVGHAPRCAPGPASVKTYAKTRHCRHMARAAVWHCDLFDLDYVSPCVPHFAAPRRSGRRVWRAYSRSIESGAAKQGTNGGSSSATRSKLGRRCGPMVKRWPLVNRLDTGPLQRSGCRTSGRTFGRSWGPTRGPEVGSNALAGAPGNSA